MNKKIGMTYKHTTFGGDVVEKSLTLVFEEDDRTHMCSFKISREALETLLTIAKQQGVDISILETVHVR